MAGDAAARLRYLEDSVSVLWPGTAGHRRVVLPTARAPRILAPVRPPRAAAAALVRYTAQQGPRERALGLAAALGLRAGLARLLPDSGGPRPAGADSHESIDALLTRVLGEPVLSTLPLTPARANRKPVLQVFDRRGRTVAFAKVGITALARTLVAAEARTLVDLARAGERGELAALDPPRVLHHGDWGDTTVLVTTALPLGRRVRPDAALLQAAMRAVAGLGEPDAGAAYLAALRERVDALATDATIDPVTDVGVWRGLLDELSRDGAAQGQATGAWHGDWTAWNCSGRRGRLAVWDWERFVSPVPRGFDRLHFAFNDAVGKRRTAFGRAAPALVDAASDLLRPWGVPAAAARRCAALYLFDLALRYVADGAGPHVEQWARPAVGAALRCEPRGVITR